MTLINGHAPPIYTHGLVGKEDSLRPHPQTSFSETNIDPSSFFGKLRKLYSETVLKTQLEQMRQQGSYDAFKLEWHPAYDVRRHKGGKTRQDGIPPSLFWESDVGKWIEAVCYFLASPDGASSVHAKEFESCVQELVDMIEKAQQPDGYLCIYFIVVDPAGKFKNLRDLHEMYNTGHLLEAALAHYHYTGSKQFINVMIKCVDCFIQQFGPGPEQLHGYPGHPELELAVLRLHALTRDPKHLAFAEYLLAARGVKREDQDGKSYFPYEATVRKDDVHAATLPDLNHMTYNQSHLPLQEQQTIEGHSVRAFYLLTAAADFGQKFLVDAKRIWDDSVDKKMYATGGFGSEPRTEGFDPVPYRLPNSTDEGGCYAETCASIACMMTSERILSHNLDGKVRDILERCLYNNVIGGGSLNGKQFSYANKHATYGDETAARADWFEVCCCPPNLSRTLGMLGGYTWSANVDESSKTIHLDVYLLIAASRVIEIPGGQAKVTMQSSLPSRGGVSFEFEAPEGWKWAIRLPQPEYAEDIKVSEPTQQDSGFLSLELPASSSAKMTFSLPIRLLASHPATRQDTLTIQRGPIVYVAESIDNASLEDAYPHFAGLGIKSTTTFEESTINIGGLDLPALTTSSGQVFASDQIANDSVYSVVGSGSPARSWKKLDGERLTFVPWFARANRGGKGHVRVAMMRADEAA